MPALFVLLIICVIRALTLPGAGDGLKFIFHVDFSQVTPAIVLAAMGLAFFKLSLGMGTMIAYGSYFTEEADLSTAPLKIAVADICVSMLAGLAIFPTVFSFGLEPGAGPGCRAGPGPRREPDGRVTRRGVHIRSLMPRRISHQFTG